MLFCLSVGRAEVGGRHEPRATREEGPHLVSTDPLIWISDLQWAPWPCPASPLSCSFKTLLLLFKDEQDRRKRRPLPCTPYIPHGGHRKRGGGVHESSFLPGLGDIFPVTCPQAAAHAHLETKGMS